jgi:hypothetical protein
VHAPEPHSADVAHISPSTFAHVPAVADSPHDFPAPQSALPQQTPSVQNSASSQGALALHG